VKAQPAPGGAGLLFTVTDTGVGIPAEHHDRVFQEFAQIENPLQRTVKGTGLGLSLSRKLAELLGGGVGFDSRAGAGSTFWVRAPLVYRAPGEPCPGPDAAPVHGKILIVDDEEISRYLIRQSLLLPEELILEAKNGAEGLARARCELPAAIFLDLRMPELDGAAVLEMLKKDPATRAIPVIVVTSKRVTPELFVKLEAAAAVLSKDILTRPDAGEVMRGALARAGVLVENLTAHR